jgi:phosphoribosylanthranilate isomerase
MSLMVKICGLTTMATLDAALQGGASHVGLVFFPKSPRDVTLDKAAALATHARGKAKVVGLFVNPDPDYIDAVRSVVRLDIIQLHGDERPGLVSRIGSAHGLEIWKAIAVQTAQDVREGRKYLGSAQRLLYDAKPPAGAPLPGGTGQRFDWRILTGVSHALPWALAGGLTADTLREAVALTGATMLDVSSGVESAPGIKDVDKINAFLKAAAEL